MKITLLKMGSNASLDCVQDSHKKGLSMEKCNYRPVSLLPTLLKVFEGPTKFLCGFRKGYSSQHDLPNMQIQVWKVAWTTLEKLVPFLWTCQKPSIVFLMTY